MRAREWVGEWAIEVRPWASCGVGRGVSGTWREGWGGGLRWAFCRGPFSGAGRAGECISRRRLRWCRLLGSGTCRGVGWQR
jgi:hypothetical protein